MNLLIDAILHPELIFPNKLNENATTVNSLYNHLYIFNYTDLIIFNFSLLFSWAHKI